MYQELFMINVMRKLKAIEGRKYYPVYPIENLGSIIITKESIYIIWDGITIKMTILFKLHGYRVI